MDPAHRQLVEQASRGEAGALDKLLERHLPGLLAYVRLHAGKRVLDRDSSMDLVQSACREVLADLSRMHDQGEANFKHWLYCAAERKIIDRARHHGRAKRDVGREVPIDPGPASGATRALLHEYATFCTPSQDAIANEEIERVEKAFDELSAEHREVIVLSRIVGLSHAEIADRMEKSEIAVRALLHRALARLARLTR